MFRHIKQSKPLQAAILLALVLIAYHPSISNGFIWDDDCYVTANSTLANMTGLKDIWMDRGATIQYYPMTFTTFWIEYQIFGPNPAIYHITNIVLHGANAILVWLILMRLGAPWPWLAAALFALHPVNVESVTWISERKNVLSGFFVLFSFLIMIRRYLTEPVNPSLSARRRQSRYAAALILFFLALLSKSAVCMMPVVFLIVVWWKDKNQLFKTAMAAIPFFIAAILAGINTTLLEKINVGAQGPGWEMGFIERILIAGRALWFYAGKVIWPANLVFSYPRWEINAASGWQYLFPIAAVALLFMLFLAKNRTGKGLPAGTAIFAVILFPSLGFINYYPMRFSFVADHFQYLAAIALIALIIAGAHRLTVGRRPAQIAMCGLMAVLLLILGGRTIQAQKKYKNAETLWNDTLQKNPSSSMALNNLGCVLMNEQGKPDKAIEIFRATLKINPDYPEAIYNLARVYTYKEDYRTARTYYRDLLKHPQTIPPDLLADTHYNMGVILTREKKFDAADAHFSTALASKHYPPKAYTHLGELMRDSGRPAKAIQYFAEALAKKPEYPQARFNLARIFYDSGYPEKAMAQYTLLAQDTKTPADLLADVHKNLALITAARQLNKDLAAQPDSADLYNRLGLLMLDAGQKDKAVEAFNKTVQIDPGRTQARYRLAVLLAEQGKVDEAISQYAYILAHDRNVPAGLLADTHNDLGIIDARHKQYDNATAHFKSALALIPDFPEAHNNLGLALVSLGRRDEARAQFEKALTAKPDFLDAADNLVRIYRNKGQYDKALAVLKSLLIVSPQSSASISYNIGCLYAIGGDLKTASLWLENAIDDGFYMKNLLKNDADLKSLRNSRYYPGLLKRIERERLSRSREMTNSDTTDLSQASWPP